jgi:hypothetical protein
MDFEANSSGIKGIPIVMQLTLIRCRWPDQPEFSYHGE